VGSCPALKITKKGALDSQPQVIKFTSCLPMVGGSPGTPASFITKTGRHDIAESGVKHNKSIYIAKMSDVSITVIYHTIFRYVLWQGIISSIVNLGQLMSTTWCITKFLRI
jgi:hypothetical protein